MSVRRPPPGAQISTGRIRVDAARAIAKLREYRLADPAAWILEAVRAAVGSGATRITLDGDADDVWLCWDGPAWPTELLPDLFDELVSPEAGRDSYHVRLLAGAINSALGLDPSWIDIIAVSGGAAQRVRFSPDTVTPDADGAAPLDDLQVENVDVPRGVGDPSMIVHLRRSPGLETLGRFLTGSEPPELALARWACRDIAIEMLIDGKPVGRAVHGDDIVRVPLGDDLDGFVAIAHPELLRGARSLPAMDAAELGVRVVRNAWDEHANLPLRLFINGARMPTNASRSQVRTDDHPIAAAKKRADAHVATLVEQLVARLRETPDDPTLRAAALAMIAPRIAGSDWSGSATSLPPTLMPLARLPLVRNAVGNRRAPAEYWRGPVYRGDEPLPEALSPWLGTMAWIPPGDAAEVLLGGDMPDAGEAKRAIKAARRRLQARRSFLTQPEAAAKVELRADARVRATIEESDGLSGEVSVTLAPGPGRLTLLHEGRAIETATFEAPVAIDAVIAGARVMPDEKYRGVVRDDGFRKAERAARIAAIRAIDVLVGDGGHPGVEVSAPRRLETDAELAMVALGMAHKDGYRVDDDSGLGRAEVWPTSDGTRVSLATLRHQRVIAVATRDDAVVPPTGRMLVFASTAERALLSSLLGPGTALVPYSRAEAKPLLDPGLTLAHAMAARRGQAALVRREGAFAGAVGFDHGASTLAMCHRGRNVAFVARQTTFVICAIAVDSEALVPAEDWASVRDDGGIAALDLVAWERDLLQETVRALLGEPSPDLVVPRRPLRLEDATGHALCKALAGKRAAHVLGDALTAKLRAEPLFRVLGRPELRSIDQICAAFGDDIPSLHTDELPDAEDFEGWHPLIASEAVGQLVTALSGRKVVDASGEVAERRKAANRRRKLAEHRARPVEKLELPASCVPMALPEGAPLGVVGVGEPGRLEVIILVEKRRFARLLSSPDLPLRAIVDVSADVVDLVRGEVGAQQQGKIVTAVKNAAGPLLAHVAKQEPEMLADDANTRALLTAWLELAGDGHKKVHEALRSARAWPTIQGDRASLAAAANGPTVPTAAWSGDWLSGDPADALDGPVLALAENDDGEALRGILDAIGPWPTNDVTAEVRRLQARRRLASGKVRAPTVPGAARELTRRLDELDVHHTFGFGEIALDDDNVSRLLVHYEGEHRGTVALDVRPAVRIAIESPDLADYVALHELSGAKKEELARQVQPLALALVSDVAKAHDHGVALPPWLRRRLATAVLEERLEATRVAAIPLFMTTTGAWASWNDIAAQQVMFDDVWYVTGEPEGPPLDNRRKVLYLSGSDARLASRLGAVTFLDGSRELALDAQARRNRAQAPIARLELPASVVGGAMAVAELHTTAGRRHGFVAPLRPSAVAMRVLRSFRQMVPFEPASDPCVWPTVAMVEDPDLSGDRTWRSAAENAVWHALLQDVRATSESAIRQWLTAPAGTLVSELVDEWPRARDSALWDESQVRGVVWLDETARKRGARGLVTVSTPHGDVELDAPSDAPLQGRLYVVPEPRGLIDAVKALCRSRYERMARHASVWRDPEPVADADTTQGVQHGARRRGTMGPHEPSTLEAGPPPKPRPAHRLQRLADAVRDRIADDAGVGIGHDVRIDESRGEPAVGVRGDRVWLAGESEMLAAVAAAHDERLAWAPAAIEAIAAHCATLLEL